MQIEFFKKYEEAKNLGLKKQASQHIKQFVESFDGGDEEKLWVKDYLEQRDYGHKVRHELYDRVIFPYLKEGYLKNDPWALYWLAETIQNIYSSEKLHEQIDYKSDYFLLKQSFKLDSSNDDIRKSLLNSIANQLGYATHEWPTGVLYAPDESPKDLIDEIEFGRSLDKEGKYTELFEETLDIVKQDMQRQGLSLV
ncbi:hypothetical protein [Aliikangiella sp. G2MR2-5]|uniref:hypothetical protein n=1 Tax=Aliikangiella sp. G2MR2-5 TaxID=2788943 RepID=UPI0018AAE539|nr:hypothetical protein [Aliikangiella sp. G2MR2-5]